MKRASNFPGLTLLCLWALCSNAYAEVRLDLNLKSKPSYRGVLQVTDNNPVAQGLLEYAADTGFYAGVWASRLETPRDGRDVEIDYFVGYQRRLAEWLALDLTLQRYTYKGAEFGDDYDWTELQVATHWGDHLTVMAAVGENWIGRDERSHVVEASYRYAISDHVTAFVSVGQHFAEDVITDNFAYREVGLSTMLAGFGAHVSWTDIAGADPGPFRTDNTINLSISRRFSF